MMSNQGKTNMTGRIDEQAAFRHRITELCPIGSLGFYLFSQYHILRNDVPNFAPAYDDPHGGELGYRAWYQMLLFPGGKNSHTEMTYES